MKRVTARACAIVLLMALCSCTISASIAYAANGDDTGDSHSFRPLSVIGKDDRITVTDTYEYPFSAIAYLEAKASCGCSWSGTGFMVLPDILLTAGHCLCCAEHQTPADVIDFYFGYEENGKYAYKYDGHWDSYYGTTFPGGYSDSNVEHDFGVVRFYENIGYETGYFGMSILSDNQFQGAQVRVAGYRHGLLKYDTNRAEVYSDQSVYLYTDTEPGNSGGPVYNGETACGINIASSGYGDYNLAHRINGEIFDRVFEMTRSGCVDPRDASRKVSAIVVDPSQTGVDGYVLPQAATHRYTRNELSGLSTWGLYIARNEIPARHGYIFGKADLEEYFGGKSWYKGTLTGEEFRSIVGILNETEEANVDTILRMELEKDSDFVPEDIDPIVVDPNSTIADGYVLPQSGKHEYTKKELSSLSDWGLYIARNEIAARHGYIFDKGDLKEYFGGKTWYKGTLTGEEFRSIVGILNKVEEANVDTILALEEQRNSPYRPKQ